VDRSQQRHRAGRDERHLIDFERHGPRYSLNRAGGPRGHEQLETSASPASTGMRRLAEDTDGTADQWMKGLRP